jgi:ABC-type glycerol-3-phosphate transport system substrate-binding protein
MTVEMLAHIRFHRTSGRKQNRHLKWWLLIVAASLVLSCGDRHGEQVEVTFAAALLPSEQSKYTDILQQFSQQTGIAVHLISQQYGQIRSAIEAEAQAGRGELDLAELDVYLLPIMRPLMQPLDALLESPHELSTQVPEDAWEVCIFGEDENLYYLPHRLNWQAMIYDHTVLEKPPADWDELKDVARRFPGSIGLKCARYEGLVCDLFPFLWQAGGDPLHPGSAAALEAMIYLTDLSSSLNEAARSYKENTILQAQEHQEILLHFNWPFAVPLLREKELLPQRMKTAPLPAGSAGRATVLGGGYLGIPNTAPHPHEAALLADYLTSPQTQQQLVARLGWFPIRPEGWEALTPEDRKIFDGYLVMAEEVRARPNMTHYEQVSQIWQDGFYRIVFEKEEPRTVLEEMQEKIDELIGDGQS